MDDSVLQMFLEDTREHLADIETDLLDIEEAGDDFDPELVNKVFRTAHSIKGSAGFLALDTIRDLSHKIETVLDMVRSNEMAPTPDVINVVLKSFDRLEVLVDNIQESNSMDISDFVNALNSLITGALPPEQQDSVTTNTAVGRPDKERVFTLTQHELTQAQKGGNFLYMVEYDLIHDVHKKGETPLDLLKYLEKSGRILDCKVDISAVGDLTTELSNRLPFFVLFASILEPDLIKAVFQVEEKYIHQVTEADTVLVAEQAPEEKPEKIPEDSPQPAPADEPTAPPRSEVVHETVEGFVLQGSGKEGSLILTGAITVEQVAKVKTAMLTGLDKFTVFSVDCSQVDDADIAFLQLLFSLSRTGKSRGVTIKCLVNPSAEVLEVAEKAGFTQSHLQSCGLAGE